MTIDRWLQDNPPAEMPFWPGAAYTEVFGIRSHQETMYNGANPGHLGTDRAGSPAALLMPFDGSLEWLPYPDSDMGSILRLKPAHQDFEIQVFHTVAPGNTDHIDEPYVVRRTPLPVRPGNLGRSTGVHTHMEVLFRYTAEIRRRFEFQLSDGA